MGSWFVRGLDAKLFSIQPSNKWLRHNIHYEVIMGSHAYGTTENSSDFDIYGWAIPPKSILLPHTTGYIGVGPAPENFEQVQLHHVDDKIAGRQYDFVIYNLIKYINLVAENNPNMIDSLFVPTNCITHITAAASLIRDSRRKFLHKGSYKKFKSYAYSQIHKIRIQGNHKLTTNRLKNIALNGLDTKFAYHCVRLVSEAMMILTEGDLDLQANREQLKAIRRGEWDLDKLNKWFADQEINLENAFSQSKLPVAPDWPWINNLVHNVLEDHYGSLSEVVKYDVGQAILADLKLLIGKYS